MTLHWLNQSTAEYQEQSTLFEPPWIKQTVYLFSNLSVYLFISFIIVINWRRGVDCFLWKRIVAPAPEETPIMKNLSLLRCSLCLWCISLSLSLSLYKMYKNVQNAMGWICTRNQTRVKVSCKSVIWSWIVTLWRSGVRPPRNLSSGVSIPNSG